MAIPLYTGTAGMATSTGNITVLYPEDRQVNDILILLVSSAAQNVTTPSGWNFITSSSIGTAGGAGAVAIFAYWRRYESGVSQVVADSGSYTTGAIFGFRYAVNSGSPINAFNSSTATASTSVSTPAVTTTVRDCVVLMGIGTDQDIATAQFTGTPVNANLANINLLLNASTTNGVGGGIVAIDGDKMTAGSTGNTTGSLLNSQVTAYVTIAIAPAPSTVKAMFT